MKIAGILTIGNEILQGYTIDLNANSISKQLTKRNIKTTIHLTVPDDIHKIKEKVETQPTSSAKDLFDELFGEK